MFKNLFKLIFNYLIFVLFFFFSSYLFWSSVSIITRHIFVFNFLFSCLIASFTLAKVGTKYSSLHVLMNFISAAIFFYFVFDFSYCLTTFSKSCPCFLLTSLKILFRGYNLIINKTTRSIVIILTHRQKINNYYFCQYKNYIFGFTC